MTTSNPAAIQIGTDPGARVGEAAERGLPEPSGVLKGFSIRVRAALAALAPWGYQDETGFHFGIQPAGHTITHPAIW